MLAVVSIGDLSNLSRWIIATAMPYPTDLHR